MFFVVQFILNWFMLTIYFHIIDTFTYTDGNSTAFIMKIISGIILMFIMSPHINGYAHAIAGDDDD